MTFDTFFNVKHRLSLQVFILCVTEQLSVVYENTDLEKYYLNGLALTGLTTYVILLCILIII